MVEHFHKILASDEKAITRLHKLYINMVTLKMSYRDICRSADLFPILYPSVRSPKLKYNTSMTSLLQDGNS